ncbi:hypothetical protein OIU79_028676 [Salix purpurea]|uniref:Uncharacterized protein n=1 Tax=Salix purpurea TaxID=77065 RepID=A0A9Q0VXB6_SALPP|nr:hypothetical protein OIU79_028676 [Salix purpurea]
MNAAFRGSTKQNHFLGSPKNGLFYQPSTHHFPRRNYMQCQCLSARKLSHSLAHQFLHPPYYSRISIMESWNPRFYTKQEIQFRIY